MIQENINPYSEIEFKEYFKNTDIFLNIKKDFPFSLFKDIIPDEVLKISYEILKNAEVLTPRQQFTAPVFSLVPFYYIDFLLKNNPKVIYDIGCGWNIFKKYIPSIIGIDIEYAKKFTYKYADVYDDKLRNFEKYCNNHFAEYESIIAINSLHYYPISRIRKRLIDISKLLSTNGKAFICFNIKRMLEFEEKINPEGIIANMDYKELEIWIRKELFDLPFEIEVFELLQLNEQTIDEYLNGNLRIVFKKN